MPPSIIAPKVGILYLFKNVPKFTKIINFTIVLIPIIYLILKSLFDTELAVEFTPIGFFKRPWTLFTFPFFQPDILSIIFLPLIHFISCKYFEPQWTSKELLFFWFFINASSALATSFVYSVAYTIKQKPEDYEQIVIKGLLPTLAAFTVAYKQAIPEYKIKLFKNFIGFKLKQLPGLFLVIILIRSLLLRSFQYLVISWFGIFISWVYLRFFKVQDSIRGDRSETFSFISFFPAIMRPPLKILSNSIYALLVKLRLCRPIHRISSLDLESGQFPSRAVFPSLSSPTSSTTPVESSTQDYDRRRAMALKALDERLKTSQLSPILESKSNADESN